MVFDSYIATIHEARLIQPILKRRDQWRVRAGRRAVEKPNERLYWLLRPSSERPRRSGAAERGNEFTSPHSFTRAETKSGRRQSITFLD